MQSAMINTLVVGTARIDAPVLAIAKAPDDGRFFDALKAGAAVEAPAATTPVNPAAASVGKVPVAMMRPPDVSSPEVGVAKTAAKAHEEGTSQDTGAVSVAKPEAVNEEGQSEETAPQDRESLGAAEGSAALQQNAQPLLATTVLTPENGNAQAATTVVSTPPTAQTAKTEVAAINSEYKSDDAVASGDILPVPARTPANVAPAPVASAPQARQDIYAQGAPIVSATVSTAENGKDQAAKNVVNTSPTVQTATTEVAPTKSEYKSADSVVSSGQAPVPAQAPAIVAADRVVSAPPTSQDTELPAEPSLASPVLTSENGKPQVVTNVAKPSVAGTKSEYKSDDAVASAHTVPVSAPGQVPSTVATAPVVSQPQARQDIAPAAQAIQSRTVSTPANGTAQAATNVADTSVAWTKSEYKSEDAVASAETAPVFAPAQAPSPVATAPVVSAPQARQDAVPQAEPSLETAVSTPVNGKAQAVKIVPNTSATVPNAKAEVAGTKSDRKTEPVAVSVDAAPGAAQTPSVATTAPVVSAPQTQPDAEPPVEPIVAATVSTPVIGKTQPTKGLASTSAASGTAKTEVAGKKSDGKSDDAVAAGDTAPVAAQAAAIVATVPVVSASQVSQHTLPKAESTPANDLKIGNTTAKTSAAVVKKSDSKAAAAGDVPAATASVAPVLHDADAPTAAGKGAVDATGNVTGNVAATSGHVAHGPVATNGTTTAKVSESGAQSSASSASSAAAASTPANSDLRTLVSTPNVLEIGFASGSHGWLKVRAELDGTGEVAASVVAATAKAAEGLHKELPGLSQYLAGEHVTVSSLVVNATGKGAEAQDVSTGADSTGTQAGGRQGEGQSGSGNRTQTSNGVDPGVPSTGAWTDVEGGWQGVQFPAPMLADANGSGSWLSVRV